MFKRLRSSKIFRFPFFIWISLSGLLVVVGIGLISLGYPAPATELENLEEPLYQESIESHPIAPDSLEGMMIRAIETVTPAVVSINTERTEVDEFFNRFFEQFPEQKREFTRPGLGSGMLIHEDGYILTNEHVIHEVDKDKIKVTFSDGRTLKAEIVGVDKEGDIAVLKVPGNNFSVVKLGDSDAIRVGQWVLTLGYPYGFDLSQLKKEYKPTVTAGIISALDRAMPAGTGEEARFYSGLIQTDASINRGNSGGPLINIYGEVIGINAVILTPSGGSVGMGFAIPVNKAKRILNNLVEYGEIKWPWIGISMEELTPELSEELGIEKGVRIRGVEKDSPADEAEVQPGDILIKIDGKEVGSSLEVKEEVLKVRVGEEIILTIRRNGEELEIPIITTQKGEVGEIILVKEDFIKDELLGVEVRNITSELEETYKLREEEEGVVITRVESGSPMDKVGMNAGDVIRKINGESIKDLDDFKKAMEKVEPGDKVLVGANCKMWGRIWSVSTDIYIPK